MQWIIQILVKALLGPLTHMCTDSYKLQWCIALLCRERGEKIPARGLNGVWQAHLPFSETNAWLWQPWQLWIVVPTLSLDLLHPSNSATQYIPADCKLHLSQTSLKLIKELHQQEKTVSKLMHVQFNIISLWYCLYCTYLWQHSLLPLIIHYYHMNFNYSNKRVSPVRTHIKTAVTNKTFFAAFKCWRVRRGRVPCPLTSVMNIFWLKPVT